MALVDRVIANMVFRKLYCFQGSDCSLIQYLLYSKCSNNFLVLFSNKILVILDGISECLSEQQTGKTLIRLILLHCLSSESMVAQW